MLAFHLFIFYGSFLVFPFILLLIWLSVRKSSKKVLLWITVPLLLLSFIFVYARFIERYWIRVYDEHLTFSAEKEFPRLSRVKNASHVNSPQKNLLKVAVFSDPHLGVYKKSDFLKRVVDKMNAENPDLVLIPGDFTYYVDPKDYENLFASLREIKAPVYAVTGNHDAEKPGELTSEDVRAMVSPHDVFMIDNQKTEITVKDQKITIVGLSDIWEGLTDYELLKDLSEDSLNFVLAHNPDAAYEMVDYFQRVHGAPVQNVDLVVSGHTHGGQIRIPWLYKKMIPTRHDFDQGFYDVENLKVFVTSGVGEVGLPMRFLVAPEVVVMNIDVESE